MFVSEYIPFAVHGCCDLLCVDTRGGQRQGCVREFGSEGADESEPESASRPRWSILAASREVDVSRTAGNNKSSGYKTYRNGAAVGFVPALEQLVVREINAWCLYWDERMRSPIYAMRDRVFERSQAGWVDRSRRSRANYAGLESRATIIGRLRSSTCWN